MHNIKELEKRAELAAFLMSVEPFGLEEDELTALFNAAPHERVAHRDVSRVFSGEIPLPKDWWPRLRLYDKRVQQRQKILAMEAACNSFGHITSDVFTVDVQSAFDRDAAGRAIRSLPEHSRAFIMPLSFWQR